MVGIDFVSDEMHVAIRRTRDLGVSFEQVTFETANIMKRQFPPGSFDVIYSKDAICCIKDKATLFKRFYVSNSFVFISDCTLISTCCLIFLNSAAITEIRVFACVRAYPLPLCLSLSLCVCVCVCIPICEVWL